MPTYHVRLLDSRHDRRTFSSGSDALDRYLRQQAHQDQRRHAAAVYVLVPDDADTIVGYHTLSSCSIEATELAADVARRLPRYPVLPGILIGRLALDRGHQGQGLGARLLGDALERANALSIRLGAVAVVVDAKDKAARRFYERHGFQRFASQPMRLYLPIRTIGEGIRGEGSWTREGG